MESEVLMGLFKYKESGILDRRREEDAESDIMLLITSELGMITSTDACQEPNDTQESLASVRKAALLRKLILSSRMSEGDYVKDHKKV